MTWAHAQETEEGRRAIEEKRLALEEKKLQQHCEKGRRAEKREKSASS